MNITGFFRKTQVTFVKKQHENGDVYSFYFSAKKPLKHIAGQHALFMFPGLKGVHIFSLASAPEEEHIRISTHVRKESTYKQRLNSLQPGDTMTLFGPVLDFVLDSDMHAAVFLAQGIGITPFRSMLVHADIAKLSIDTTLIHVDSDGHVFKDQTKALATTAFYPTDTQTFVETVKQTVNADATYYLSGSPRFVKATKRTLKEIGGTGIRIKTDRFIGY